jgi:hypothetical protein
VEKVAFNIILKGREGFMEETLFELDFEGSESIPEE